MSRQDRTFATVTIALIAAIIVLGFVTACTTVVPKPVDTDVASFDGNDQNSGIIRATSAGYVVTPHFRDRYNALVAVYGKDFTVPLKRDAGLAKLSPTEWLIDRQHLVQFLDMAAWQRSGLPPKTK